MPPRVTTTAVVAAPSASALCACGDAAGHGHQSGRLPCCFQRRQWVGGYSPNVVAVAECALGGGALGVVLPDAWPAGDADAEPHGVEHRVARWTRRHGVEVVVGALSARVYCDDPPQGAGARPSSARLSQGK